MQKSVKFQSLNDSSELTAGQYGREFISAIDKEQIVMTPKIVSMS